MGSEVKLKLHERLKLLRALTGLTQHELAELMGASLFLAQSLCDGRKRLTDRRAEMLADCFNVDKEWLVGECDQILGEKRYAFFTYDGKKAVGSTAVVRKRSANINAKYLDSFLAKLIPESGVSYRFIGRVNSGSSLIFIVFDGQGLMLKIDDSEVIAKKMEEIVTGLEGAHQCIEPCSIELFSSIADSNPEGQKAFIEKIDINYNQKQDFKNSVDKHFSWLSSRAASPSEKAMHKSVAEATRDYTNKQKPKILKRICSELMVNNIRLAEVREILVKAERCDLI